MLLNGLLCVGQPCPPPPRLPHPTPSPEESTPNIWYPGQTLSRWQWPRQVSARASPAPPSLHGVDLAAFLPAPARCPVCRAHPACGLDAFGPQPRPQEAIRGFYFYLCSPSQGGRTCPSPPPCGASTLTPRLGDGQSFLLVSPVLALVTPQQECRGGGGSAGPVICSP